MFHKTALLTPVLLLSLTCIAAASSTYDKPFLKRGTAVIGGYMDMEFIANQDRSTFDQHRFVPFIFATVSDRVHVASEIEFEHGGLVTGDGGTDGEIKLEFATIDFTATEAVSFRAGVILSPVGRLNVQHDAPMLDLTDRPLVTRRIIPTTLSESGMGFFGTLYPSEASVVDYEIYLVNGFDDDAVDGSRINMRSGRGSQKTDNNNSRAVVAHLGLSPRLGLNLGASVHTGDYDAGGDHNLTLAAFDASFATGALEVLGEFAFVQADLPKMDAAKAQGYYVEGRYHFWPGFVPSLPQSIFTAVARFDYVDRDSNVSGDDVERASLGINFRPTEDTVFKQDLVFDRSRGTKEGGSDWSDFDLGYRFSVATYF